VSADYQKLGEALGKIAVQVRNLDERADRLERQRDSLLTALIGCIEHMEYSNPQGEQACNAAQALIMVLGGDA
jgi:hypothetical protein